jgi:acetolactate synthase small subunit
MSRVLHASPAAAEPAFTKAADQLPLWPTVCFALSATPEPGVMSRVLEPFAKRGLVPHRLHAVCGGAGGDELVIDLQIAGLEPALVELIAASLRQIVGVESVLTAEKRYARSA